MRVATPRSMLTHLLVVEVLQDGIKRLCSRSIRDLQELLRHAQEAHARALIGGSAGENEALSCDLARVVRAIHTHPHDAAAHAEAPY